MAFHPFEIQLNEDAKKAFRDAAKWKEDALLVVTAGGMTGHRKSIIDLAAKMRLPVIYTSTTWIKYGGLMAYHANLPQIRRRAAAFVDKILKGAKPADLPVERPKKFDLVINLKAAKALGITIPPFVLLRAHEVIE